ncbi:ATP-grasp domain-containing protein [Lentibacillus cibarius]|uniref:ATP-grasp domain-containing protein n=1 Tax=Lentibacillus cibarius TaxID=2583219 RepID=A0A5S3QKU9_9BACI|nr:hypothetical protein [Lentibacillus cibarius]TMN21086.1 hypothetical protein FFL34_02410 [Lentibacillus cibarius]
MQGWLIYNDVDAKQNESFIKWFLEEARLQNITLLFIRREELTIGVFQNRRTVLLHQKPVALPDFAVVRTIDSMLSLQLESLGINVYNPSETAIICNNKALTHFHLSKLDVPTADTMFVPKGTPLPAEAPMPFPFVVKDTGGRGGKQVHLVISDTSWNNLRARFTDNHDLIIQSATNVQQGKDVRVFVIGERIIGAVLRENKHDFRANFKLGGSASWYSLTDQEQKIVHKITGYFQFGMAGIDFLLDNDGCLLFNEIEDVVGSRTLSAVSDINIVRQYIAYIKSGNASL